MIEKTGYGIAVSFANAPTLTLHCKATKDPGIKSPGKIDQSTNDTTGAKEFCPGDLMEIDDSELTAAYDVDDRAKAIAIYNLETSITITHTKTGKKIVVTGWLASFEPQEAKTGAQTEVKVKLEFKGGATNPAGVVSAV